jgi:phosphoribosyl 1,2-cyclic phosphodiesterase
MKQDFTNMRIHFYGVQGSGSVFPAKAERDESRLHSDLQLLEKVFQNLEDNHSTAGKLNCSIEEILGEPLNRQSLTKFRAQFDLPEQRVYGGWTTCFRIETSDGYDIVIDCGSGFRICAEDIMAKWGDADDRHLYILGSHAHFDHTEGFDQAAVCFDPRNNIHIYANHEYLKSLDQNLGIFSHRIDMELGGIQTPLNYELMPAHFDSIELRDFAKKSPPKEGDPMVGRYHDIQQPVQIGKTTITAFEVFHPDPCLGFRIEHNGKVFIYCSDHELRKGDNDDNPLQIASQQAEQRLIEHSMNADVLYRDGQFFEVEYLGHQGIGSPIGVSRKDWGHSCIEDVMDMAERCNVKKTYIGHHDPNRTWAERNWIDETLQRRSEQSGQHFEMAKAETVIDL